MDLDYINPNLDYEKIQETLKRENFLPEIGDIVDWNEQYWEINSVVEPQLIAGHPSYKHSIIAKAHRAKLSSLQIEERPR